MTEWFEETEVESEKIGDLYVIITPEAKIGEVVCDTLCQVPEVQYNLTTFQYTGYCILQANKSGIVFVTPFYYISSADTIATPLRITQPMHPHPSMMNSGTNISTYVKWLSP
jgi:hypothetical protein